MSRSIEARRRWNAMNADRMRAYRARYRKRHPERVAAHNRAYFQSPAGREAIARAHRRSVLVGAHSARMAVLGAVKRGELVRKPCAVCSAEVVEAHHHLGYAREQVAS